MMNDKELLQMLEVLGRNSRKSKSLSLAASVVSENKDNHLRLMILNAPRP